MSPFKNLQKLFVIILILITSNISAAEKIKIALLDTYPWAYESSSGVITGIYPDLFNRVSNNLEQDVVFDISILPLARIIHYIKNKKIDLTIMSFHPSRKDSMKPLVKIYESPFVLITKKSSPLKKISDITNRNVSMLLGGSSCPCVDISYQRLYVTNHQQSLKLLMSERVDAASGPLLRLNKVIKKENLSKFLAEPIVYEYRDIYLWGKLNIRASATIQKVTSLFMNELLQKELIEQLSYHFSSEEIKLMNIATSD